MFYTANVQFLCPFLNQRSAAKILTSGDSSLSDGFRFGGGASLPGSDSARARITPFPMGASTSQSGCPTLEWNFGNHLAVPLRMITKAKKIIYIIFLLRH